MTFQTCDLSPFVAKVVAQKGTLEDAASALQIFIRQLEGYLRELKLAICVDLGNTGSVRDFTDLLDVPHSYLGQANKLVRVNAAQTGLEFFTSAFATAFLDLSDAPHSYVGQSLKGVRVNALETALEFYLRSLIGLSDFPASYSGAALKFLRVNAGATAVEFITAALTLLSDFPASYSGQALKALRVNAGANAVEFFTQALTLLSDFPASYSGAANKILSVNAAGTAVEFSSVTVQSGQLNVGDAIILPEISLPAAPAANKGLLYASLLGNTELTFSDANGINRPIRSMYPAGRPWISVFGNGAAGLGSLGNISVTANGTLSNPAVANTNIMTASWRTKCTTGTGAGNAAGFTPSGAKAIFFGGAAGQGGFYYHCRFGIETTLAQQRAIVGLHDLSNTIGGTLPSNFVNVVAIGHEAGDTNWKLIHNDGSGAATTATLGANFPVSASAVFDLFFFVAPNSSTVQYAVVNVGTNQVTTGSFSSDVPAALTGLSHLFLISNGSSNPSTASLSLIGSCYAEGNPIGGFP